MEKVEKKERREAGIDKTRDEHDVRRSRNIRYEDAKRVVGVQVPALAVQAYCCSFVINTYRQHFINN